MYVKQLTVVKSRKGISNDIQVHKTQQRQYALNSPKEYEYFNTLHAPLT